MSAQVAADLRAAAEVLRRDGWTQGTYHVRRPDDSACHCASGALAVATGAHVNPRWVDGCYERGQGSLEEYLRWDEARHVLEDIVGDSVPGYNDAPSRTAAEVIAALEAAADAAETSLTAPS